MLDIPEYLHRLGLTEPVSVSQECLELLTRSHLKAIPFENLQIIQEHSVPSLEPEALFEKIIRQKRGGYCFELNKLFSLLLESLGFDCTPVAARVIHGRQEPCPLSHRATIVTVEGKRFFCDVGFGGAGPKGILSLETEEAQTIAGEAFTAYREADSYVISIIQNGNPEPVLRIQDQPWLDVDFEVLNRYYATYPGSPFRLKRILYRCTEEGWYSLVDSLFTSCHHGKRTERTLASEEEILHIIRETFGFSVK